MNMSTPTTRSELLRQSDQEARQMLRQRKKRDKASCYPCRTRKVKCDRGSPCNNCAKRGYPELCSFSAPRAHVDLGAGSASPKPQSVGVTQGHHPQELALQGQVRSNNSPATRDSGDIEIDYPVNNGSDGLSEREPFLGTNSLPAFLRNEASLTSSTQGTPSQAVEDAILPILGLQGCKSIYPFLPAPSTSMERVNQELRQALPIDREIIRLFRVFRTEAHPFSPIIPDIDGFELELCEYLEDRKSENSHFKPQSHNSHGTGSWKSISWVGSLFAILASGTQYSDSSFQERQAKSQIYVRYSFHCLRMANFLVRPSILCIQCLLILGNVLQNDMKPEAAWILLGTTARMAHSLGLHNERNTSCLQGQAIWLALVWQDSLLSLCFDRLPVTLPATRDMQLAGEFSYANAMHVLCDRTLRAINVREYGNSPDFPLMLRTVAGIEDIYLQIHTSNSRLTSIGQRCEICALKLHVSFVIAWLCRPALRNQGSPELKTEVQVQLIEKCQKYLLECVRAFVQLHSLSILASRSWAVIHNGLSSALLLGLLGTTRANPEVRQMQSEILEVFNLDQERGSNQGKDKEGNNTELSSPHARIIAALRKLHEEEGNNYDDFTRPLLVETGGPHQEMAGDLLQPNLQDWQSGAVPRADMQSPGAFSQNLSALDMFDSIWDPTRSDGLVPDYDPMSFDPWVF